MKVLGIEHFANKIGQPARAGDICGVLLAGIGVDEIHRGDFLVAARTTEGATQTDLADEQGDDGRVEADPVDYGVRCVAPR